MNKLPKKSSNRLTSLLRQADLPKLTKALQTAYPKAEIFLVGGYVRDLLIGRKSKDIDLVIRGVPPKKLESFLRRLGQVNLVGREFGVYKFMPKGKNIQALDIALPRTEISFKTGGYRDFKIKSDARLPIEDDLARRDFTVNAIALNLLNKKIIDPWNGQKDLKNKIIRAVGEPKIRFKEDYSRLLRGIRFACQLKFKIETKTWQEIKKEAQKINIKRENEFVVPRETVAKELLKAFTANPTQALDLFDQAGLVKALIPELLKMKKCPQPKNFHSEGDVWQHTRLALEIAAGKKFKKKFGEKADAEIIIATLFHDIAKPSTITYPKKAGERIRFDGHDAKGAQIAKQISERLKLSSYKEKNIDIDAERLAWLIKYHILLANGNPKEMRATTIEKYYLRDLKLGRALLALQFADGSATVNPKGELALKEYEIIKKRITELTRGRKKKVLPDPILDGNEIMKTLKLKPGKEIGRLILILREAQLSGKVKTKKEAHKLLKSTRLSLVEPYEA